MDKRISRMIPENVLASEHIPHTNPNNDTDMLLSEPFYQQWFPE